MGHQANNELEIYKHLKRVSKDEPGHDASVRTLLDTFYVSGPEDKHQCLVHLPLWESVLTFLRRNPIERLPSAVVAVVLQHIKADNIMFGINDDSVFRDFEDQELQRPVPRKEIGIDGRTVYMSRDLRMPKQLGAPVLCDFGSAVLGDQSHAGFVQPDIYRAPEVILGVPWTYSVDIWNVGCMIWDIYEGGSLFTGQDPEFQKYRSRAHLAEMINLLGPPPPSLLAQAGLRDKFFSDEGDFHAKHLLKDPVPLEKRETTLEGQEEREAFLRLMRKMLQWDPSKRSSPKELAEDEWIHRHL
ncbi:hypothetical protein FQN54_001782 [Arachnomyces sp. PD_36]|nr:hypothetical protein FQN54_001782 [Arachnomyces sp. PD_36]